MRTRAVELLGWDSVAHVAKTFLMPALAARYVRAPRSPGYHPVLVAQGLSWVGDVALNGRGQGRFLAGLTSFLGAHLAYIQAYRGRSSEGVLATSGRRRVATLGALTTTAMAVAAGREERAMAVPVAAYGLTLTTMVTAAAAIDADRGRAAVLTGASLFMLSDSLIGLRTFILGDEDSVALETAVLSTYAAAQWCIGEGMAGRSVDPRR
jgi:uncharacterized membrane protein YhhN